MSYIKYEGISFDLDPTALQKAATHLPLWVQRVIGDTNLEGLIASVPESTGAFAEEAFEIDDGDGSLNFVQALAIASAIAAELSSAEHEGAMSVDTDDAPLAIVHGSLTVKGDLNLHTGMLVLGDLHVTGRLRDIEPYSRLMVVGNLRATTIFSRSPIWVSGAIEAKVLHLGYHGKTFVGEKLHTQLLLESSESRGVDGIVDARAHSPALAWQTSGRDALAALREMIVSEAYVENDEGNAFEVDRLLAMAEAGDTFLANRP